MSKNQNIIFYSKSCKTCANLFETLNNERLLKYFKLICVDDCLTEISKQIRTVPTMLVYNVNKPLEGSDTFKWIEQLKFMKQQKLSQLKKDNDPVGWSNDEMNRLSDNFAYTENKSPEQKYFKLNSEKSNEIFTPPVMSTIKKHEQKKLLEQSKKTRMIQNDQYKHMAKQYHIDVLHDADLKQKLPNNIYNRRRH